MIKRNPSTSINQRRVKAIDKFHMGPQQAGRNKIVPHTELRSLVFGQQHIGTQDFFTEDLGQCHTVPLEAMPHYRFLKDHLSEPTGANIYASYLERSWDYHYGKSKNTRERRLEQIDRFLNLFREIERGKHLGARAFRKPVVLVRRPDGKLAIVDGNHRAAIALCLGLDVPVKVCLPADYLRRICTIPAEYYGSSRLDRPYQSIFREGIELVEGRRRDVHERMLKIDAEDLQNRTVIELGCNIGVNCLLASERGAFHAVGIDISPRIATAAVRLHAFFGVANRFIVQDVGRQSLDMEPADVVMCFSVARHVHHLDILASNIRAVTKRILFFEGHAGDRKEDYPQLLNRENFSSIELIGYNSDGIHSTRSTRPMFRCEVN